MVNFNVTIYKYLVHKIIFIKMEKNIAFPVVFDGFFIKPTTLNDNMVLGN